MSNAPNKALFGLSVLFSIIFGAALLCGLFYFVMFIIELAKTSWIAIPVGICALIYLIMSSLSMQPK